MNFLCLALAVLPLGLSLAAPQPSHLSRRATAPADDSFYTPPSGFEDEALGTILNNRTVDVAIFGLVPIPVTAYQLLYRTQSQNGTALATVTTVFVPVNATSNLVAFSTAEDSSSSICAPSYNYQLADPQTDLIVTVEALLLEGLINQGYIVTAADYEGPNNAFAVGRLEGYAVLDSIRATTAFLGLSNDTQVAGYGYSGGAIATGWAAALQPLYAPELNVVGWAHGGTPANLSGTLSYLDGTFWSGFGFAGVAGVSHAYQSINDLIEEIGTPLAKAAISDVVEQQCAVVDLLAFAFETLQSDTWTSAGDQLLYLPTVVAVTDESLLGKYANETPTAPLYIYHSASDEIIDVLYADNMVNSYCANGVKSLVYERDIGLSEHASMEILGYPNVVNFLADRFNGVAAQDGCSITNVTTTLTDPGYLGTSLELILGYLIDILEDAIGLSDEILTANLTAQANSSDNTWLQQANATAQAGNTTSTRFRWRW